LASFGKVCFSKFGIFLEITIFFKLKIILQKKFGNNSLLLGQKVQKSLEKFGNRGSKLSEFMENSEFVLFQTFQKL
jgi:hypothetical protein